MMDVLKESGWKFKFMIEAVSSRGFRYQAGGESYEEAFLKAFGQWRQELISSSPAIPPVLVKIKESIAAVVTERPSRQLFTEVVHELLKKHRRELLPCLHTRKRIVPTQDPILRRTRKWRRLYMRAYRLQKNIMDQDLQLAV